MSEVASTATSKEVMTMASFPQYARLPNEVKFMVWEEFVKAEAASRIVPLNTCLGDVGSDHGVPEDYWLVLSIMPLKRLISPALRLCVISRKVALRHYRTRVSIYEMPMSIDRVCFVERVDPVEEGPRTRLFHPIAEPKPVWDDRDSWTAQIEGWLTDEAFHGMVDGPEEDEDAEMDADDDLHNGAEDEVTSNTESDADNDARDGAEDEEEEYTEEITDYDCCGCIYLDLATDRFLPVSQWMTIYPRERIYYGLREVSDMFSDFKYHGTTVDKETLEAILARRPPVLRNASGHLSDEVLMGIRHVVFPSYPHPPELGDGNNPWSIEADPEEDVTAINTPGTPLEPSLYGPATFPASSWARTLPGAFGATPSSTTWGFAASNEVYRSFFDDIEDKGPEHLYIQEAVRINSASDPEDWHLVWGGGGANDEDGTSSEDSDDDDANNEDGSNASSDEEDGSSGGEESDFEMGIYSDDGSIGNGNSTGGDNDDEPWE